MLIDFRFSNFRSFRNEVTISFTPRITLVHGANGSGKSNVCVAMAFFRSFVLRSAKSNSTDEIDTEPFKLSRTMLETPSLFETTVFLSGTYFRYGFEVNKHKVLNEWLFAKTNERKDEVMIFTRQGQSVKTHRKVIRESSQFVLPNTLLLSRLDQMNYSLATSLLKEYYRINLFFGLDSIDSGLAVYTAKHFEDPELHDEIMSFLRTADNTIVGGEERLVANGDSMKAGKSQAPLVDFKRYSDDDDALVTFNFLKEESTGTQRMFALAGPLADILKKGDVAFMDEFEAKLHPLLVYYIASLFADKRTNPNGAQLVAFLHDTILMRRLGLPQNAIYLCEKNLRGESTVYPLSNFNKIQESEVEDYYLKGRFGGVPPLFDGDYVKETKTTVGAHICRTRSSELDRRSV